MMSTQNNQNDNKKVPNTKEQNNSISLGKAIGDELIDRAKGFRLNVSIEPKEIIKAVISLILLILFAMLETTFFTRFSPFGAVPDLMISFVAALGISEGRNKGGVWALFAVIVIESLGGMKYGLHILPLLYVPAGYFAGYVTEEHLIDSIPVRAIIIAVSCLGRGIITAITAMYTLSANMVQILVDIVLPEIFSTMVLAIFVHLIVWLCFLPFKKSKKDRGSKF